MCNGCVAQSYWFTLSYHDACYCSFPGLKSNRPPEHHSHFLSHIFKLFHPIAVPLILPLKAHSSHDRINSTWVSLFPYLNLLESPFWHCSPQISFKSRELLVPDFRSSHAVLPFLGSKEQNNQKKKNNLTFLLIAHWLFDPTATPSTVVVVVVVRVNADPA